MTILVNRFSNSSQICENATRTVRSVKIFVAFRPLCLWCETLVLVPLGLPFFLPLAFADRLGLNFWPAFGIGMLLASCTVGTWLWLGPK